MVVMGMATDIRTIVQFFLDFRKMLIDTLIGVYSKLFQYFEKQPNSATPI